MGKLHFRFVAATLMAATFGLVVMGQTAEDPRQQAMALEQQGNNADAETAWRAVLKAHPS